MKITHVLRKVKRMVGKEMVNFAVKRMGVKPYDTALLPLPSDPPRIQNSFKPIVFRAEVFNPLGRIPDEVIRQKMAVEFLKSEDVRNSFILTNSDARTESTTLDSLR